MIKGNSKISDLITSSKEAQQLFSSGIQKFQEVASFLAQKDLSNPKGYRLMRAAAWLRIDELPAAINGKTRIPPPDDKLRDILNDLKISGNWKALLQSGTGRTLR